MRCAKCLNEYQDKVRKENRAQKDLLAAKQFLANALLLVERYQQTLVPESYDAAVVGPMPHEIRELIRNIERVND
jgi:hypothetical protein